MAAWLVVLVPLLIMLFALGMERVERRLRDLAVREEEVEEFLEQAKPEEVRALYGQGIGRALELFRLRRRTPRRARSATRAPRHTEASTESSGPGTQPGGESGGQTGQQDGRQAGQRATVGNEHESGGAAGAAEERPDGELRHPDRDAAGRS